MLRHRPVLTDTTPAGYGAAEGCRYVSDLPQDYFRFQKVVALRRSRARTILQSVSMATGADGNRDLSEHLNSLRQRRDRIDETIHRHQEATSALARANQHLQLERELISIMISVYEKLDNDNLQRLSDEEYGHLVRPIIITENQPLFYYSSDAEDVTRQLIDQFTEYESSTALTSLAASTAFGSSVTSCTFISDRDTIYENVDKLVDLRRAIEIMKHDLASIDPDLVAELDHLVESYYAAPLHAGRYQQLIAARSFFYYKLVDGTIESMYPNRLSQTRKERLSLFACGPAEPPTGKPVIDEAMESWSLLSDQGKGGQPSAKTGTIASESIEPLWKRIIATFAFLIHQHIAPKLHQ